MGFDRTQTESRDSFHLQVKVCEWRKKDTSDDFASVGKRPVGKCVMDADKGNEQCDRHLERAHHLCDIGYQERCRGGDGSMVEKTPSCWTRCTQES